MITRVLQSVMLLTDIQIFTFVNFLQLTEPILLRFRSQILLLGRVFDKLALRGITWFISRGLLCSSIILVYYMKYLSVSAQLSNDLSAENIFKGR